MRILPSSLSRQVSLPTLWHFRRALMVVALAGCVALSACDPQRIEKLEEGVATEADVRREFGEPAAVWDGPNGSRVLEYNRQPEGHKNYQITIGTDGKMSALRQLLTPENFAKVQPGMPMEQVRKMLGKPAEIKRYDLSQETHMNWRFREGNGPQSQMFTVVLNPQMMVVKTSIGPDMQSADIKGG
jgi:hypothetical protein